jgi:hypothetical protein
MTIGAIAELIVKNPKVLNDPLLHRIPTVMSIERLKANKELTTNQRCAIVES